VFCRDKYNLYTRRRFSELVREKTGVVFFTSITCTQEEGSQDSSGKRREWSLSWIARDAIESGLGSN
jgi:hypothetical protein